MTEANQAIYLIRVYEETVHIWFTESQSLVYMYRVCVFVQTLQLIKVNVFTILSNQEHLSFLLGFTATL